jgi:hypothetical protein
MGTYRFLYFAEIGDYQMVAFIHNSLGQCDPNFIPGITRRYGNPITKAALWMPLLLQTIQSSNQIITTVKIWKNEIKSLFVLRENENPTLGNARIFYNVCRIVAYAMIATATAVLLVYASRIGFINTIFLKSREWVSRRSLFQSIYSLAAKIYSLNLSVPRSPKLILATYSLLGSVHLWQVGSPQADTRPQKFKHIFAATMAFSTLFMMCSGRAPVAWSSSAIGLTLMFPKLHAVNMIRLISEPFLRKISIHLLNICATQVAFKSSQINFS